MGIQVAFVLTDIDIFVTCWCCTLVQVGSNNTSCFFGVFNCSKYVAREGTDNLTSLQKHSYRVTGVESATCSFRTIVADETTNNWKNFTVFFYQSGIRGCWVEDYPLQPLVN